MPDKKLETVLATGLVSIKVTPEGQLTITHEHRSGETARILDLRSIGVVEVCVELEWSRELNRMVSVVTVLGD